MANKVITVTTPSVGTGDTVASYNAYSDQDGALGSLSVAEAAAGKTFSLSDGVVHSVTVKPVGTSSGEYNAPSNAVTVDLSVSGDPLNRFTNQYFTDSNTDGLADGLTLTPSTGVASIVTDAGATGNGQRLVHGTAPGQIVLTLTEIASGTPSIMTFKAKSGGDGTSRIRLLDGLFTIQLVTKDQPIASFSKSFTPTANLTTLYIESGYQGTNGWIEVYDFVIKPA